jgi:hypothetical protein
MWVDVLLVRAVVEILPEAPMTVLDEMAVVHDASLKIFAVAEVEKAKVTEALAEVP